MNDILWLIAFLGSSLGLAVCVGKLLNVRTQRDFWADLEQIGREVEEARAKIR